MASTTLAETPAAFSLRRREPAASCWAWMRCENITSCRTATAPSTENGRAARSALCLLPERTNGTGAHSSFCATAPSIPGTSSMMSRVRSSGINFGGTLGGPIKKDKLFLFGNYEGYQQRLALSQLAIVPDNCARQGLMSTVSAAACAGPVPNLKMRILPFVNAF